MRLHLRSTNRMQLYIYICIYNYNTLPISRETDIYKLHATYMACLMSMTRFLQYRMTNGEETASQDMLSDLLHTLGMDQQVIVLSSAEPVSPSFGFHMICSSLAQKFL